MRNCAKRKKEKKKNTRKRQLPIGVLTNILQKVNHVRKTITHAYENIFDKDAIIRIGDVKAKVKMNNSKKAVAIFCMNDLQKVETDSFRMISATNPDAKRGKARKQK